MELEIYHLIDDKYQYKSVSYIQKISNYPLIHLDYDYKLNLQINNLSNTIETYLDKADLKRCLIDPIRDLMNHKQLDINVSIENFILPDCVGYYKFINLIYNELLVNYIKIRGCGYGVNLHFYIEDDRFINVQPEIVLRIGFLKIRPKEIKPNKLIFSIPEAKNLLAMLKSI